MCTKFGSLNPALGILDVGVAPAVNVVRVWKHMHSSRLREIVHDAGGLCWQDLKSVPMRLRLRPEAPFLGARHGSRPIPRPESLRAHPELSMNSDARVCSQQREELPFYSFSSSS